MPLLRIDMVEGRPDAEIAVLLDVLHGCVLEAFGVPERDRFQIVTEHKPGRMVLQDVGLGMERTDRVIVIQMTTTPRPLSARKAFYRLVVERLEAACGQRPEDVIINLVTASESDWSFGGGVPQFLTGQL